MGQVIDPSKFKALIYSVFERHNKKPSRFEEASWWNNCKDKNYDILKASIYKHYQLSPFLPKEADIMKHYDEMENDLKEPCSWSQSNENTLVAYNRLYVEALSNKDFKKVKDIASKISLLEIKKSQCA